ncbi:MAG: ribosome small subunit-dependent GTPase A [Saprospiraceae bacterium]|nr:ribosome small subunit-dependent GTPase A [Saprospiraceae bacterium]MBP6693870.1 ribosome small subunit-dependent GTPase A [Saprospiraceae bacterium]
MSEKLTGVVTKSTGSWYLVRIGTDIIQCRVKGKIKLDDLKLTNPIAVGDQVIIEMEPKEDVASIVTILPRKNYIVRQSPRKKHLLHFMASNVDQVLLIVTLKNPNLKLGFIDRFLLMTEPYSIPVVIVFNKADIYNEEDMKLFNYIKTTYKNIGYQVLLCSAETNIGIDDCKNILKDKTTLVSGQSGVGKSTLINQIQPRLLIKTEEISDFSGKGQHTTTFAEMYTLDIGGQIIDSPGIKTLGFSHFDKKDVAHNFKEFFTISSECKFADCLHMNEPNCAVKKAVESGKIAEFRYQNYLAIIDEVENQNYWEIHDDV